MVATVDQSGAGVLVVYDALGNEVFAVRGGKVFAPSFKPAAATAPAHPNATRDLVEERIRRARRTSRPVDQPDMLGKKPYLSVELLDWADRGVFHSKTRWRVAIRVTNTSPYDLKSVTFQPEIAGEYLRDSRGARVALTANDLGRGDHDILIFSYDHEDTRKGQPRRARFRITSVSTKEGQSRIP